MSLNTKQSDNGFRSALTIMMHFSKRSPHIFGHNQIVPCLRDRTEQLPKHKKNTHKIVEDDRQGRLASLHSAFDTKTMPPPIPHAEKDKGDEVCIDGGLCEGLHGWIHDNATAFDDKAWIIVAPGTSKKKKVNEKETAGLLAAHNFTTLGKGEKFISEEPATCEEALLKEHKDIAQDMKNLARKLAQFDSCDPEDGAEMLILLWHQWMKEKSKRSLMARVGGTRFVRSFTTISGSTQSAGPNVATPMDATVFHDDISSVGEGFGAPAQEGAVTDDENSDDGGLSHQEMKKKLTRSALGTRGPHVVF